MIQEKTFIIRTERLNPNYFIIWLKATDEIVASLPGQFFEIKVPSSDLALLRKPISVFDIRDNSIGFMIKKIGTGTKFLFDAQEGQIIDFIGPLGNPFTLSHNKKILLVSGGIGYAPLFYLRRKLQSNNNVFWLHGGRTADDIFEGCDAIYTDDGSRGNKGIVTVGMKNILSERAFDMIYCCGPNIMMKKCAEIARNYEIPIEVSLEEYMACGVGACYGCAVAIKTDNSFVYKRVCKDGPVFKGEEVVWNE